MVNTNISQMGPMDIGSAKWKSPPIPSASKKKLPGEKHGGIHPSPQQKTKEYTPED